MAMADVDSKRSRLESFPSSPSPSDGEGCLESDVERLTDSKSPASPEKVKTRCRVYYDPAKEASVETRFRIIDAYLASQSPQNLYSYLRMLPQEFTALYTKLMPLIDGRKRTHRYPITPIHRVALFLRFITVGGAVSDLATEMSLGTSTLTLIITEISSAITEVFGDELFPVPTRESLQQSALEFEARFNYPRAVLAVDSFQITYGTASVTTPPSSMITRIQQSFKLILAVDGFHRIVRFDMGHNKATAEIYAQKWGLGEQLEDLHDAFPETSGLGLAGEVPFHAVGSGEFPMCERLIRPFSSRMLCNDVSSARTEFNGRASRVQSVARDTMSVLRDRFAILKQFCQQKGSSLRITVACMCLHNLSVSLISPPAFRSRFFTNSLETVTTLPSDEYGIPEAALVFRDRIVQYIADTLSTSDQDKTV